MRKTHAAVAALMLLSSVGATPLLRAEDSHPGHKMHRMGEGRDEMPERHLEKMTQELGLTPDQKQQVKTLMDEKHQKMMAAQKEYKEKFLAILNEDQKKKFEAMKEEKKKEWENKKENRSDKK